MDVLEAILDARLLRMGFLPETVVSSLGRERLIVLGGVPCRLLATSGSVTPILHELARHGRAYAVSTCVLDGCPEHVVVHGPPATAPAAAMQRVVRRFWDRMAVAAVRQASHA